MAHHPSVFQEHGLVQHPLHIPDQVGGDEHRAVFVVVGENGIHNVVPGRRVHPGDGLIQQVQLGLPAHHQSQLELLLGALGHGFDPVFFLDAQPLAHFRSLGCVKVLVKVPEKSHKVPHLHPVCNVHPVRQVAHLSLGVGTGGVAVNQQLPGGRLQKTAQELDEGGFSRAVGAQQSHNPAPADGKLHLLQGGFGAVVLGQSPALNDKVIHEVSSFS